MFPFRNFPWLKYEVTVILFETLLSSKSSFIRPVQQTKICFVMLPFGYCITLYCYSEQHSHWLSVGSFDSDDTGVLCIPHVLFAYFLSRLIYNNSQWNALWNVSEHLEEVYASLMGRLVVMEWDWRLRTAASTGLLFIPVITMWWYGCKYIYVTGHGWVNSLVSVYCFHKAAYKS
jgi:hypothetical protein